VLTELQTRCFLSNNGQAYAAQKDLMRAHLERRSSDSPARQQHVREFGEGDRGLAGIEIAKRVSAKFGLIAGFYYGRRPAT
jgi:hypothetical protein